MNKKTEIQAEKETPVVDTNATTKPKKKKKKIITIIVVVLVIIFGIGLMSNEDIQNDINAGWEAGDKYYEEAGEELEAEEEEEPVEETEEDEGSYVTNTVEESDLSDLGARFTFDAEEFIDMYNDLINEIGEDNDTDCSSLLLPDLSEWIEEDDETVNGNYFKTYFFINNLNNATTTFSITVDEEDKVTGINYIDESLNTSVAFWETILAVASGNGNIDTYRKIIEEMSNNIGPTHYMIGNTAATFNGDTAMVMAVSDSVIEDFEDPYFLK